MTRGLAAVRRRSTVRPILDVHPGVILAALDVVGLAIASYLSIVELAGGVPSCGLIKGCEEVARSEYSRIGGIPVAVFGVALSIVLLALALAWWRSNLHALLLAHYGLSLAGVVFEVYFSYLQVFVIGAVCIWCTSYGLSLVARFAVALIVWVRGTTPEPVAPPA
ncbi:MAG TPA: vitamin K epoxide reductase family protein [Candidatus Binatia bacterium]|nr:vitamin K epoxide reductase family protein [Candidatus Binatia bacterium]